MFQISFDMSVCVYQAGAEGEKSVVRQGGKKRRPFGLMCEDPHTYLTERFTTVGICSKPRQRERTGTLRGDFLLNRRRQRELKREMLHCSRWRGRIKGQTHTDTHTRKMLSVEMYPSLTLGPQRIGDCFYRGECVFMHQSVRDGTRYDTHKETCLNASKTVCFQYPDCLSKIKKWVFIRYRGVRLT